MTQYTGDSAETLAHRAIERAARESYGRLCAVILGLTGDVMRAEDALGDALLAAIQRWPVTGVPASPDAWLMTTALRKAIDLNRRDSVRDSFIASACDAAMTEFHGPATAVDGRDTIVDERLRLLFVCTHPALDPEIRTPLMLQAALGFDARSISAVFLSSPSAMAQRLVRAKRKIRDAGIPFTVPSAELLPERIDAVLRAIYAAYCHGWTDPLGVDTERRDFAEEAIWLARMLFEVCPGEPEVRGLLSLILYLESRRHARRSATGDYVPLSEQPTERWDHTLVDEAESLLVSARSFGKIGRFQLEAAIQSAHATRARTGDTDWPAIARLYDALYLILPSPVVAINRAISIAETVDASTALRALNRLESDPRMRTYQPYWAARAELFARVGEESRAAAAYEQAIGLSEDPAVRSFLAGRSSKILNGGINDNPRRSSGDTEIGVTHAPGSLPATATDQTRG